MVDREVFSGETKSSDFCLVIWCISLC